MLAASASTSSKAGGKQGLNLRYMREAVQDRLKLAAGLQLDFSGNEVRLQSCRLILILSGVDQAAVACVC